MKVVSNTPSQNVKGQKNTTKQGYTQRLCATLTVHKRPEPEIKILVDAVSDLFEK
jgi:hypothetical protein